MPDYRGRFLRGLQSGHSVGETVANTLKSHNHTTYAYTFVFRSARQHSLIRYCGRAIIFFCGKSRSQRVGCRTIHHERRSGGQIYQTVQGSGGTWISISQTGNDSGIAGGRVSITRTTEEALKGTSPFGDRNTLVAPGVYESRSGGGVAGFTVGGSSTVAATTSGGSIWGSTGGGSISGTARPMPAAFLGHFEMEV